MTIGRIPSVEGGIQPTIFDAKADLLTATAADTPARLAVGNNGETLVADSSTSTGLRYQEPKAGNPVINSAYQVWQRGTSFSIAASTTGSYTADRWSTSTNANQAITVSRQTTSDTTNLPNIQYCLRYQRNSGQTGTGTLILANNFESINSIPFAGKTVTVSFFARKGADYSASSSVLTYNLQSGTGTDQSVWTGFTGSVENTGNVTLTTTWQRFTGTATIASTATQLCLRFQFTPVGTASTNDYYEITGVQLEVGSVATPFKTQAVTLAGELAACQRYYWRAGGDNAYQYFTTGLFTATTNARFIVQSPVTMRTAPTSIDFSNLWVGDGVSSFTPSATAIDVGSRNAQAFNCTVSGATQYRPAYLLANNSTSAYIGFSAEL